MGKHFIEMIPEELNSFFMEKYSFGLYPFALIVAHVFLVGGLLKSENWPCNEDLTDLQRKLRNIKKKIIDALSDYHINIFGYQARDPNLKKILKKNMDFAEMFLGDTYKLDVFFKWIDRTIKSFEAVKKDRQPGARLKKRNFIITLWSQLVQSEGYRINWEIIADLIDWFWERLGVYSFYSELNPQKKTPSDLDVLKNQFYRSKKLTHEHFLDIRWGYFNNRLKNRRKFSQVVIFSKVGIKIEKYSYLSKFYNGTLKREYKEIIPLFENILANDVDTRKLLHLTWVTEASAYHATKLYIKNPKSPPHIIFPDFSHL